MKQLFKVTLFAASIFAAVQGRAQTNEDHSIGHKITKTAKTVGHKTSEIAVKGESGVVDKKYDGKWGPHGEKIYINKGSRYYYVDKKGHKVYVTKSQLRDKPYR
ncbi:MAG TPA: hypothetical protein VGC01_11225 [Mucilaginibacter sp.]